MTVSESPEAQMRTAVRRLLSSKHEENLRKQVSDVLGMAVEKSAAARLERDLNKQLPQ